MVYLRDIPIPMTINLQINPSNERNSNEKLTIQTKLTTCAIRSVSLFKYLLKTFKLFSFFSFGSDTEFATLKNPNNKKLKTNNGKWLIFLLF